MKIDTKEGIQACLTSLETLNELANARRKAYYTDKHCLKWFMIMGRWVFDECGNFGRVGEPNLKETCPDIPDVLTREELTAFSKARRKDESFSYSLTESGVPPAKVHCAVCGKKWTIKDCHDAMTVNKDIVLPLKDHIGSTLKQLQEFLNKKEDGVYWLCSERPIRNDRFIDLTPHPKYDSLKINEHGWVGKHEGLDTANYVIAEGDEASVRVFQFEHHKCYKDKKADDEKKHFEEIFTAAGYNKHELKEIPNQYCPCERCAPWYLVKTEVGTFKIGWRKRVINIDWEKTKLLAVLSLFAGEDVTKGEHYIHAWGKEKAIEYLAKMRTHK